MSGRIIDRPDGAMLDEADLALLREGHGREAGDRQLTRLADATSIAFARVRRRASGEERPVPLPWPEMGYMLGGGYWPGMHTFLAGTGKGKTQATIQIADGAASNGVPVVLVSLEMTRDDLLLRMACSRIGVHWSKLATGRATADEIDRAEAVATELAALPIYVEQADPGKWDAADMRELGARLRRAHPTGSALIVVDYLQLCGGAERELRERIGATAYAGRAIAREHDLVIVLISSVARDKYAFLASAVETAGLGFGRAYGCAGNVRVVKNPDALIGLGKESGEIEFAADTQTVLVKWPTPLDDGRTLMLAVAAKVRAGPPGWCALAFDGARFVACPVREMADLPEVERRSGRPKVDDEEYRDRVLRAVRSHPGLTSKRAVCGAVKGDATKVREALRELVDDGDIKLGNAGYVVEVHDD